ncbi:MAG: hypothetical protein NT158_11575 [Cyanobacteria bacterium]|nr:hypothetical protein [Cyanobacteriota bacterium]
MGFSAKTEYGIVSLIELAAVYDQGLVLQVAEIAQRQGKGGLPTGPAPSGGLGGPGGQLPGRGGLVPQQLGPGDGGI